MLGSERSSGRTSATKGPSARAALAGQGICGITTALATYQCERVAVNYGGYNTYVQIAATKIPLANLVQIVVMLATAEYDGEVGELGKIRHARGQLVVRPGTRSPPRASKKRHDVLST